MRLLLSGTIFLLIAACAGTPVAQTPADSSRTIPLAQSYNLQSHIMGEDREINVWTPPGYGETTNRHTVLYLIDGGADQDFPHIAGLGQLGAVSGTYESLIIVGVRTHTRLAELTPPPTDARYNQAFPQAGHAAQFRDFLRAEVIPFVEARYRTGERRAVMGESLAGLFVMDTLLNEPTLFHDYIAVSPSLWWDDRAFARSAAPRLAAGETTGRRVFVSIADEDGTMRDGFNIMQRALETARHRLSVRLMDRPNETHATTFHPAALDALRWLYQSPPIDYGPTPWWMVEGGSPPAQAPN